MSIGRKRAPLTVQNAEVRTAAVEIKTLSVSGKQVTLSVFRQIPHADLVNEDGTLNGVPWGRVNYFWGDISGVSQPAFQHVLWQSGAELFRHIMQAKYYTQPDLAAPYATCSQVKEVKYGADGRPVETWVDCDVRITEQMKGAGLSYETMRKSFKLAEKDNIEKQLTAIAEKENKLRAGRRAAFATILDLPQLYIAV